MNTSEIIALGLAGVALYFIVNRSTAAATTSTGKTSTGLPLYGSAPFGSDSWSEAINAAANARLQRQGSI